MNNVFSQNACMNSEYRAEVHRLEAENGLFPTLMTMQSFPSYYGNHELSHQYMANADR